MKKARRMLAFMLALSLTAVSSLSVWGESTDTETAGEETYQENSDAGSIESDAVMANRYCRFPQMREELFSHNLVAVVGKRFLQFLGTLFFC